MTAAAPADRSPLVNQVLQQAATRFGVTVVDVLGPERYQPMINARHVACWLLHEKFGMSFSEIGRILSRDHTTIMSAVRSVGGGHARPEVLDAARVLSARLCQQAQPERRIAVVPDVPDEEDETAQLVGRVIHDFALHPPTTPDVVDTLAELSNLLTRTAVGLTELVPPGRDLNLALDAVETALHWAQAGISKQQRAGSTQVHAVTSATRDHGSITGGSVTV